MDSLQGEEGEYFQESPREIDQISIRWKRWSEKGSVRRGGGGKVRVKTSHEDFFSTGFPWRQAGWPTHGFLEDAARIENRR